MLESPCAECRGEGRIIRESELEVDVPRGIHDGQQIRIRGEGHAGFRSRERGNAFVVVRVRPDSRFVRDGDDLHTVIRLTMTEAALGTSAKVPGLPDELDVEVRPGTQPGEARILEGQGMPALRGGRRGKLYVTFLVAVPTHLDDEQRRLVEELGARLGPEAYVQTDDESEGFFRRLKNALR